MKLGADVIGLTGEGAFAEERPAGGDRLGGRFGGQVDRDVRYRRCRERDEAFVVEGRDGTQARILAGELSPAGAGLVDLELVRDRLALYEGDRGEEHRVPEREDPDEHEHADERE